MGLFSKKPEQEPVRNDKVRDLLRLGMKETDAADRSVDSAAFRKAQKAYDDASRGATQAELRAAHKALRRNGY